MKNYLLLLLLPFMLALASCTHKTHPTKNMANFTIPFESNPNQTLTYDEAIACYEKMAAAFPGVVQFGPVGSTDIGKPLHVAVLSKDGEFDPERIRQSGRRILLINNGIHPGEPEGIDATVLLLRDLLTKPERQAVLDHLVLVVIPVYNVDGCLNRGSYSRANQDGPEAYGFRGNARNYDLNRDFLKCDSRNARTFNHIFTRWMPDVFVDNHTSNGADYQYTMTLIATQHNKLEAPLGTFLQKTMLPFLYKNMEKQGWEMIPYVDGPGETPDQGIFDFCDYGRYSTGYAALWNTIGFMPETHMLKPFKDRVWSTYAFMDVVLRFIHENHAALAKARSEAFDRTRTKSNFVLDWRMDRETRDSLVFKGYTAKYKASEVSGLPRLWYDRTEPFEKTIPYYNTFEPAVSVAKPVAYIIPQAWETVLSRLENNTVKMQRLTKDVTLDVEMYRIGAFKNRDAWEGHYFHSNVELQTEARKQTFHAGDYVIFTDQVANRYLVETLEPNAPDSWFAWNFFDPILMQKEYFSAYVFEDLAAAFLKERPAVRQQLEEKKKADPEFAGSARMQLDWVYRQSPWYEPTHRLYPVGRLLKSVALPLD
ncbi:MAG: M14 family metallopeptidase [Saprospiraceae bacterium]|nr:M14 family metallopeptidase [Saprospiraceae bacterium]